MSSSRSSIGSLPAIRSLAGAGRVRSRCRVCGFSEVRTDEAVDRGPVFLSECPRCEHRWTSQEPPGARVPPAAAVRPRAGRETASAA